MQINCSRDMPMITNLQDFTDTDCQFARLVTELSKLKSRTGLTLRQFSISELVHCPSMSSSVYNSGDIVPVRTYTEASRTCW